VVRCGSRAGRSLVVDQWRRWQAQDTGRSCRAAHKKTATRTQGGDETDFWRKALPTSRMGWDNGGQRSRALTRLLCSCYSKGRRAGPRTLVAPRGYDLPCTMLSRSGLVAMLEITPENALAYLRSLGQLGPGPARVEPLGWGVSNVVLRVETPGRRFVLKQSRPRLRTRDPWFSDLDRVWREQEVMQVLGPLLPAGVVPEVLSAARPN